MKFVGREIKKIEKMLNEVAPKLVALFSATNLSSYILQLHQLHYTIQIKWNYDWTHFNRVIIRIFQNFIFGTKFSSIFLLPINIHLEK